MPLRVRALRAYLAARLARERREIYRGDLLWLAAIKHTSLEDVQPYSAFCAQLERPQDAAEESAEAIYQRVIAQLKGGSV